MAVSASTEMGCVTSAFDILPVLYYPMFLLLTSLIAIALPGRKAEKAGA